MIKCGYTTIIGKTNVGKSTFLNKFLDKKVSITADKSQTTRSNIYAIKTMERTQIIFIDTPGIHKKSEKTLNKVLRKKPSEVIHDVDVIIFMVSGTKFDDVDQETLELVYQSSAKKILVYYQYFFSTRLVNQFQCFLIYIIKLCSGNHKNDYINIMDNF